MKPIRLPIVAALLFCFTGNDLFGQLEITTNNTAFALAQKLVGDGVIISNATITSNPIATGFFRNFGGPNIGMDSGIVLTNGRAKSDFRNNLIGLDGNGTFPASAQRADANLNLPGDQDLANELGIPVNQLYDAIALEFDFIPLGDSIRFNYILSSEEYTTGTVCIYYDAFAFFISGPGITGNKNIALVPGTNTPVTISNVNNIVTAGCVNNPQYYVDNTTNIYFTHEGHTTLFTARSQVQPCQTYHLKLVIADKGDHAWDTGVFLEAGSLRSDPVKFDGHTPLNEFNQPYLAEGCTGGSLHIYRNQKRPYAQTFSLSYSGTATNGVDVSLLPSTITIPANDSVVIIPVTAIADFIPEGHEKLKIYISNSCATLFSDSIEIEIRDIDILAITPADSVRICRNSPVQMEAATGYLNYAWTNGASLSASNINNPVATPGSAATNYICTATIGNCIARDSVLVKWKTISLISKTDIPCTNGTNGAITVAGTGWENPISYAINNGPFQPGNTFSGLPAGDYWAILNDPSGCKDSIPVSLIQSFPDIAISASTEAATCSITPDGNIQVTASGGNGSYTFSSDGASYQNNNVLTVAGGSYTIFVKDGNGCVATKSPIIVPKINTITLDAGLDTTLCEGTSYTIAATSNTTNINWTPTTALTNSTTLTPTANPLSTTKYYVTASFGTCTRTDSIVLKVWPAPTADAGNALPICYGITDQLNGSGGIEYHWIPDPSFVSATNISNPVVKPSATTTYYLNVKDIHGCYSLQPGAVTVAVTPSVKIFAGNDTLVAMNQPLQLHAVELSNSGVTQWKWSPAAFFDNTFTSSPIALFTSPAAIVPYEYVYTITGTTPAGCQGSDEIKIKVYQGPEIYVPSAFTPNHDGKNDWLMALPVGMKEFRFFRVFSRWGEMIFSSQNPDKGWDGTIQGIDQPSGVFVWTAEGVDYTGKTVTRRGTTTLIR
ncbi:MAG: choice-of-anchor L domain-containing protein [Bacteroidota bacterium]|nr:choice-of-anchor L domain-containing protein [Bacteroidota bacterium]